VASPAQLVIEAFEARYRSTPDLFRAPGRVNLIGEHTDYNQGFVLPIAIDLACYTGAAPNRNGLLRVYSENLREARQWPIDQISRLRPSVDWGDYIIGVARQLPLHRGQDLLIYSTVPVGAGLSSSAALEVSVALALDHTHGTPNLEMAKLCRRAENEFVGLPSGIMDQYTAALGRENAALLIDCRSLQSQPVELPDDLAIVAVDSMVKHELGQSAYRQRVAECAAAVAEIRNHDPTIETLRDANLDQLDWIHDPVALRRARHIITENQRVLEFVEACRTVDRTALGKLLMESHRSLQHDYEVSCAELDFLVDTAVAIPGALGARMTGGGFGGCTVNLVEPGKLDRFETTLSQAYQSHFKIEPRFYRVTPSRGAERIS